MELPSKPVHLEDGMVGSACSVYQKKCIGSVSRFYKIIFAWRMWFPLRAEFSLKNTTWSTLQKGKLLEPTEILSLSSAVYILWAGLGTFYIYLNTFAGLI